MIRLHPKFITALLLTGAVAGIVGMVLTWLLHAVQHLAFGVPLPAHIPFRIMVEHASPWRRLTVLLSCGWLAGTGWWLIHRFGAPLVSVGTALKTPQQLPLKTTLAHALLQIVTVAMGSPLGRESAPREMAAALSERITQALRLSGEERRTLIACAAGAGLAAVYNVPLAAVVFILETLLLTWQRHAVGAALICCGTAVAVSRWGLGDSVQYTLPLLQVDHNLLLWALLAGPLLAVGVRLFERHLAAVPPLPRNRALMIVATVVCFGCIGVLAMWLPEILGNGKAGAELSFASAISWQYALALFTAKWLAVILATAAGVYGGHITPSMMLGGLLALVLATLWNLGLPTVSTAGAALVGATIFLGLAQKMPLTAALFMLELSRFTPAYLFPICLCFLSAIPVLHALQSAQTTDF